MCLEEKRTIQKLEERSGVRWEGIGEEKTGWVDFVKTLYIYV